MQGADWNASFCEVVRKTICAALGFNKENCLFIRAAICAVIKSLSPGCITRTLCSMVETEAWSFFSECVFGFFRYGLMSESTPRSRVVEKSRRCPPILSVQEFILKLFQSDHRLQLQYHSQLVVLQILYSAV